LGGLSEGDGAVVGVGGESEVGHFEAAPVVPVEEEAVAGGVVLAAGDAGLALFVGCAFGDGVDDQEGVVGFVEVP
jgi:hypothetical protein